jgi:hypothetical protein
MLRVLFAIVALSIVPSCSKKAAPPSSKTKSYVLDKAPKLDKTLDIDFDGKVALIGYEAPSSKLKPNKKVKIKLYWKVKEKLGGDWRLVTHLLDGSGDKLVDLSNDGAIRKLKAGKPALPPSSWVPGKVIVDELSFRVPRSVKTAKVRLVAGLSSGEIRMPVVKGQKDSQQRALVAEFSVAGKKKGKNRDTVPDVSIDKLEPGTKIKIDGKLDEEAWKKAPILGPFVDVRTGKPNKTFPVNAKARLLWNDQSLFVGVEVEDKDVVGGFPAGAEDPHLWTRDTVELMIDPDWDRKNTDYYEIQINPQNLVFDSQWDDYNLPKPSPSGPFGHQDWSANLKSAVVVDGTIDKSDDVDKGYVVEASIPWKSFTKAQRSPPALGDAWRINVYAMQQNSGVAWSPILGRGNFHKSSQFGRVHFVKKGWVEPDDKASPAASASAKKGSAPPAEKGSTTRSVPSTAKPKPSSAP